MLPKISSECLYLLESSIWYQLKQLSNWGQNEDIFGHKNAKRVHTYQLNEHPKLILQKMWTQREEEEYQQKLWT